MNITEADYVEHFGVRGMHWGIRRGKSKTGVSRPRGALLDRNARNTRAINQALSGKKYKVAVGIGRAFVGKEAHTRRLKNHLSEMRKQNARIKKGKLTVEDRLTLFGTISLADLVVSRRPI